MAQTFTWQQMTPLGKTPGARYGHSIAFVEAGRFVMNGGSYSFPNDFLSDTWEFNAYANQWARLRFQDEMTPRRGHVVTYSSNKLFILGGKGRYEVIKKRLEAAVYYSPYCSTGYKLTFCSTNDKVNTKCWIEKLLFIQSLTNYSGSFPSVVRLHSMSSRLFSPTRGQKLP